MLLTVHHQAFLSLLMLATFTSHHTETSHLKADETSASARCVQVQNLMFGLTFLRFQCNAVSSSHQDQILGQLAIAFLALKATLKPATLLCAVGICVCLPCTFFVAFCSSTHRLSSLLQFAIAFSHCRLDYCASGSEAVG